MERKIAGVVVAFLLVILATVAMGQGDSFEKQRQRQQQEWEAAQKQGQALFRQSEEAWNQMLKEQQEAWARMVAEIERIWLDSVTTTRKEWVDYGDRFSTRSEVNFERGDMVLATMVQASEARIAALSRERLARQLAKALSADNVSGRSILEGQIVDSGGRPVTAQGLERYFDKELVPRIKQDPQPIVGKDGVPRYKFSVALNLVPDHTMIRARPYIPEVSRQAARFHLEPALVMAVMHTESYFDPLARSQVPAYGLMQLVPRYGARDAFQFIYGQDRLLTPDYLYQPANNIELGCGYLYLLLSQNFAEEPNPLKRLYLTICGYNWGPSSVISKIVGRYPTTRMSPEQLYQVLRQRTPRETSDYLERVTQRMTIYRPLFSGT